MAFFGMKLTGKNIIFFYAGAEFTVIIANRGGDIFFRRTIIRVQEIKKAVIFYPVKFFYRF